MKEHQIHQGYVAESDKMRMKSLRLVGFVLGFVNVLGGALLILYVAIVKTDPTALDYLIPIIMQAVGYMTLLIQRSTLTEQTKIRLYSLNYVLIPLHLYTFVNEANDPFWALIFLYVTLAFALQNRLLVFTSVAASFLGLLVLVSFTPTGISLMDHVVRFVLFVIFVLYVVWGLKMTDEREALLVAYMNRAESAAYEHPHLEIPNQLDFTLYVDYSLKDFPLFVAKIEMNEYQAICDVLGQQKCDELTRKFNRRLVETLSPAAYIAKGEGGQFLVALPIRDEETKRGEQFSSVLTELSGLYVLEAFDYMLNLSIGVADSRKDGKHSDELMRNAQFALNEARRLGLNQLAYCTSELKQSSLETIQLSDSLHRANLDEEFYLVYQPQFLLEGNRMSGVEVLVRWEHSEKGSLSPALFIDIAEKNGYIVTLGTWILKKACADIQALNRTLEEPLRVAVNVSVIQVQQPDFVNIVLSALKESGLPPQLLELELTERAFLDRHETHLSKIRELQAYGIQIAIDDFGTGYSSFDVLKKVKADKIKIPREFIDYVDENMDNQHILKTILSMAQRFGVTCLAEGIERKEENDFLIHHGGKEVQGYYYAKPVRLEVVKDQMTNLHAN